MANDEGFNYILTVVAYALTGFYRTICCQRLKVSGVGCQGKEVLDTHMKLGQNGIVSFPIRLAVFLAGGWAET
jgi:hypothetical protein